MALSNFGKSALRVTKNYSKGYSHTQIKTRNATCNDPWPPSGKEMFELSQLSYRQGDFIDIMEVIDKRLNDKGKNWRHVFKSLVVLDYLLHSGSENVILYCEDNLYVIKTLREFQYIDDYGRDQGANVRQKAKDITNLFLDRRRLFQERTARARMHDRMLGRPSTDTEDDDDDDEDGLARYRRPVARPRAQNGGDSDRRQERQNEEEENLRKAIEESKKSANARATAEERDVQRAIELSKEEEERRKRLVALAERGVFDDTDFVGLTAPLIDLDGPAHTNAIQPQFTSVQPQYTAVPVPVPVQPQYTSLQPQYTSYNPYLQQAQQEALQQEYARQQAEFARQQVEAQSAQLAALQQRQQERQRPLVPQPTAFGSNNPFAPHPSPPPSPTIPERPTTSPPRGPVPFTLTGTYDADRRRPTTTAADRDENRGRERVPLRPYSTGAEPRRRVGAEGEDERLARVFAGYEGEGVDTFGNVGQLRFGGTEFGRLAVQRTGPEGMGADGDGGGDGTNPFLNEREQERERRRSAPSVGGSTSGDLIDL